MNTTKGLLAVALVGSVDHGKSTLLGRLLHDTGSVPSAKIAQIEEWSKRRGVPLEWSFLLDSLQAERDQAVTIDIIQARIAWGGREFLFIDAPGHVEFLRNLVTGVARADAAILMVDATQGGREQTRRHAALLRSIGVLDVIVVVNKIDLCADSYAAVCSIGAIVGGHLRGLGMRLRGCVRWTLGQGQT